MKHRIEDLIDIPQLQKLMDDLNRATGINHALIDVNSKVLTAVGWQKICTDFHRVHPATCARCLESDKYILSHLDDGPYVGYRCPQGLTDYCTPVIIEGEHLANLFTGQMLHEPPDVEFFRKQAAEFGFDETSYLAALNEVRIVPKERMPGVMAFLQDLAQMLAANGMERLRVLESEKRLKSMNEMLEARVAERTHELQDSEANLRRAQRVARIGSWTLDIPNNHLVWTEETYRLFGVAPGSKLTSENFFALMIHPDDREAVSAAWQAALGGTPYIIEHRIVVDGETRWVHEQAELEFDSDGKAYFAIGSVQDITHRKLAELQTTKSLSLLQATFDATAEGILVTDGAGRITTFNQRFAELWRIPADILATGDDNAALAFVLDQFAEPEQFLDKVRQLYATPEANCLDTLHFKDGRIFERYSTPQRIDGVTAGRVWSFRDITERKQAEAKLAVSVSHLQTIIENEPECIKIIDAQGRLVQMNPAGLAMIEADSLKQVAMRPVLDVIAPEYRTAYAKLHKRVIAGETMQMEYEVLGLKGGRRWLETHAVPMQDNGQTVHLAVTRDISERKLAEMALQALNQSLEQRIREETSKNMEQERLLIQQSRLAAMGEMIGNIAHQWRQPINALTLLLANIKDAYEYNDLTKEFLDQEVEIGQNLIQKMSGTIDDFRNFFKPSKEKQRFLACDSAEEAIKLVSHSFMNSNIEITHEKSAEPCAVFGYPNEFAQVVLNALTNAKEAITARKIAGKVHLRVEKGENTATIIIRDNGGGIPEEIIGKVFDPYFTTKAAGTGIGLYMSKMIVDNMGGSIAIRNAGDGVEVLLTLPLDEKAAA
ncbi:MAG: PocR ligand-binding domain-containing protein [Betaproteobacteria bacterium]|nr:PocR ligand-binding domain-containing protein [Betaproteobacteria bacterium]